MTALGGYRDGPPRPRPVRAVRAPEPPPPDPARPEETLEKNLAGRYAFQGGGSFILDTPDHVEPIWGAGSDVLLADGEALMITGPQGLGKTTLAQQLALGRAGLPEFSTLLGYPITPGAGRVLYLAMDRPKQAARSFRRMVGEAMRAELNDRLVIWQGPPPLDMARESNLLITMCRAAGADTVVVDSLKDAALGLNDDTVAAGYNRARQHVITGGVQIVELHHPRKAANGATKAEKAIDDVFGSTWLTSGVGSVLLLSGDPGDSIVGLHHVKQAADQVGPLKIQHDHQTGRTTLWSGTVDLVALAAMPCGVTALDAAKALFENDKPTANEREKARRKLDKLTNQGLLIHLVTGSPGARSSTVWGRK